MSLLKCSRSQRHTGLGQNVTIAQELLESPSTHFATTIKQQAACVQAWQSHTDLGLEDTHTTFSLWASNSWEPKTELKWGWCLHPNPGTAVLTMWTKVLLLLLVHSKGAHYNKLFLKPFGYSLFKIQEFCFGLSNTEMLPTETKSTLGQ